MDGARGGWVAAASRRGIEGFVRFSDIIDAFPRALIMVDIPIGLDGGDRACDKAARKILGARRASVFPPPSRAQLALAGSPWRPGIGMSRQTHAILPKIAEVDRYHADPRIHEAHPELAFLLANGGRALANKKTPEGRGARERIVRRLGFEIPDRGLGVRAARDDKLDAAILCWLAEEALADRATYLGEPPYVIWGVRSRTERASPRSSRRAPASRAHG